MRGPSGLQLLPPSGEGQERGDLATLGSAWQGPAGQSRPLPGFQAAKAHGARGTRHPALSVTNITPAAALVWVGVRALRFLYNLIKFERGESHGDTGNFASVWESIYKGHE